MNPNVTAFVIRNIDPEGKSILEVGSRNVNGSVRQAIESMNPSSYTGVDIEAGPGVDEVCSVYDIGSQFPPQSFDIVICCEVMEHVKDWRKAINEMKNVLKIGGNLFVTTVDKGFPYHGYPMDFWRFSKEDFNYIFRDMRILTIEEDLPRQGIYMKAERRPIIGIEYNIKLYSILLKMRTDQTPNLHWLYGLYLKRRIRKLAVTVTPRWIKNIIKKI